MHELRERTNTNRGETDEFDRVTIDTLPSQEAIDRTFRELTSHLDALTIDPELEGGMGLKQKPGPITEDPTLAGISRAN